MIYFQDFLPQITTKGKFLTDEKYQSFSSLVDEANEWISDTGVTVLNMETILLPERDSNKSRCLTGETYSYQFIRVWYEVEDEEEVEVEDESSENLD